MQSVTGPLGIPSGEFRKDFRCNDGNQDVSDYYSKAMVEPCHFAPRADFTVRHNNFNASFSSHSNYFDVIRFQSFFKRAVAQCLRVQDRSNERSNRNDFSISMDRKSLL